MTGLPNSKGLFAALRRDRALFVLLGALTLFLHLLQPLAEANAAANGVYDVICAPSSDGTGDAPATADFDCRQCVAGPCAGLIATTPERDVAIVEFPGTVLAQDAWPPKSLPAPYRAGDPPPTTRAPPLSA